MKQRRIKGGLKTKGYRNAPYDKMSCQHNGTDKYKPHEQAYGGSAKKVKCGHKVIGKDM